MRNRPKQWVVNPALTLWSAQFKLRTRGEGGARKITFHPGLAGDWRELLRAILIATEAKPGVSAATLRRKGIAADVMPVLAELGVIVARDDVPAEVSFSCQLDRVRPRPTATRRLELNPAIHLQTGPAIPAALASRVPFGDALTKRPPILWVDDPGTGIPMPFALAGKVESIALDLIAGKLSPDRVPARWRSVFEQATILVPPRYIENRTKQWQRRCAESEEALRTKEHAILRDLLNPLQLQSLRRYMRGLRGEGYLSRDVQQVKERVVQHNEPVARFYHAPLANLIRRFTPEPTTPSYCFAAHYQAGAELKRHTDRPQCVWNLSFAVDSTPESTARTAWPLFIESRGTAHEVRLGSGDAVLYSGTNNPHWRHPQPEGHVSTMVFYHFVPANFDGSLD